MNIGPTRCIECGEVLKHARLVDPLDSGEVNPGDCSMCGSCGALAVFTDELTLRPLTPDEIEEIRAQPGYRAAMHLLRAKKAPWN